MNDHPPTEPDIAGIQARVDGTGWTSPRQAHEDSAALLRYVATLTAQLTSLKARCDMLDNALKGCEALRCDAVNALNENLSLRAKLDEAAFQEMHYKAQLESLKAEKI